MDGDTGYQLDSLCMKCDSVTYDLCKLDLLGEHLKMACLAEGQQCCLVQD